MSTQDQLKSDDSFLKQSWEVWVREGCKITNVVSELEKEIERMRERKLADNLIDQKDSMVEKIIQFYNTTDLLINAYRIALVNKNAEILMLDDCFKYALRTEWRDRILKRFTEDVNELEERKKLKQELLDKING